MNVMTAVCSVQTEDCDEEFWMTEEVLKVGEPAPDFALKDDHGCVRTLKDFQGRKLILYFYPEDETPGCTIEAQGFRDHLEDFARAGWQVVGVSNDDLAAHCGFRDHHGLNFPLLCDVDRTLSNDCALMSEQVKDGKTRIRINRSTLLIDENGRLLKVMRGVVAREHVAELLQMLCSK